MTNTPRNGRTYLIKSYKPNPDIGEDYVEIETPVIVPNGKWVMEWPVCGYNWLVGVDSDEVERITLDTRYGHYPQLYVANKPFGCSGSSAEDMDLSVYPRVPGRSRYLNCARQIHKGELGQGVPIPALKLAREAPDLSSKMHQFPRNRHQKRNHVCWARITDVLSAADLSAKEALLGFWPYIGWSYDYINKRHGTLLHVVAATSADEIQHPRVLHLDQQETCQLISSSLENVWIRAGFAKTILRLMALGVRPEVTHPA